MKLVTLSCPECGSKLEVENNLDTFYCKYCGNRIQLSGMSDAAYAARVHEKELEQQERILDKQHELERLRLKQRNRDSRRNFIKSVIHSDALPFIIFAIMMGTALILAKLGIIH